MRKILTTVLALLVLSAFVATAFAVNPGARFIQTTGGGSIISHCDPTQFATFSFTTSGVRGSIEYKDLPCNIALKGTVTVVGCLAPNSAKLFGSATVNRQSGYTYTLEVKDQGSPGKNDFVAIEINDSRNIPIYSNSGYLVNGNLKVVCP